MLFFRHYFSPLNTFMRKGKDPEPVPDPYLLIMDLYPRGPKTCGSGSGSEFPTLPGSVPKCHGSATLPSLKVVCFLDNLLPYNPLPVLGR
jgi:hypothetical protein